MIDIDTLPPGVESEQRAGDITRLTYSRSVEARCLDCELTTDNAGAAASHARSARHTVIASYKAQYVLVPGERVGAG